METSQSSSTMSTTATIRSRHHSFNKWTQGPTTSLPSRSPGSARTKSLSATQGITQFSQILQFQGLQSMFQKRSAPWPGLPNSTQGTLCQSRLGEVTAACKSTIATTHQAPYPVNRKTPSLRDSKPYSKGLGTVTSSWEISQTSIVPGGEAITHWTSITLQTT